MLNYLTVSIFFIKTWVGDKVIAIPKFQTSIPKFQTSILEWKTKGQEKTQGFLKHSLVLSR